MHEAMETTLFLAKVMGLYFMVVGPVMALRRQALGRLFDDFAGNRPLVFLASVMTLILGLLLVVSHNHWVAGWPVIVTLLSWLVLVKAVVYLFLPFDVMARSVARFNRPAWFTLGGPLTAALGLFLAGKGFQVL